MVKLAHPGCLRASTVDGCVPPWLDGDAIPNRRSHRAGGLGVYTNTTTDPRHLVVDTAGTGSKPPRSSTLAHRAAPRRENAPRAPLQPCPQRWIRELQPGSSCPPSLARAAISRSPSTRSPPPGNDTIGAATAIASLPFRDVTGTFDATTDADDDQVRRTCGVPSTGNSVWYAFTAGPGDTSVIFDTTGSTYSAASSSPRAHPGR